MCLSNQIFAKLIFNTSDIVFRCWESASFLKFKVGNYQLNIKQHELTSRIDISYITFRWKKMTSTTRTAKREKSNSTDEDVFLELEDYWTSQETPHDVHIFLKICSYFSRYIIQSKRDTEKRFGSSKELKEVNCVQSTRSLHIQMNLKFVHVLF